MQNGTPLPNIDSAEVQHFVHDGPDSLRAYRTCLEYEKQLATVDEVRFVRILGYLILYAPNLAVREEVTKFIDSHKDQNDLTDRGKYFEHYFILPFRKYKSRTPVTSESPSRLSIGSTKEEMEAEITQAPKTHKEAKDKALVRDNWRCVVTGLLHRSAPAEAKGPGPHVLSYLKCAHIIPEATFFGVEPEEDNIKVLDPGSLHSTMTQREYSTAIRAILSQFGDDINSFIGEKAHSLMNVLTMHHDVYKAFYRLELYLEATSTGKKDSYDVKTFIAPDRFQAAQRDSVTFTTKSAENFPVPSPELLALHATCCKIAHFSGSAEHIDAVYDESEEIGVLDSDGTSDDILRYKLFPLADCMTRSGPE